MTPISAHEWAAYMYFESTSYYTVGP